MLWNRVTMVLPYGGNPFVTAAVSKVFDMFESRNILDNVNNVSVYLDEKLRELVGKYDVLKETRGLGLMRGLEFNVPVGPYINKALEKGLLITQRELTLSVLCRRWSLQKKM